MPVQRKRAAKHGKYILPLFVIASALVFAVLFAIVVMPAVVTKFGFIPVLILLLVVSGVTSAILAILFYLLLKREIRF